MEQCNLCSAIFCSNGILYQIDLKLYILGGDQLMYYLCTTEKVCPIHYSLRL